MLIVVWLLAQAETEEIERAFSICDANADGVLNCSELQLYLFGLGACISYSWLV